ncbi:unnamed protein product [Rotaria magnacalcarata]|uniref:Exocyst complex component Sec8 n=1 Tax=Rotaria magnacalcarata TaxID=392030 RepID=A0A8S2K9B9_9BILA|nr:unnamed protein product [Rotaria magnacalcarata]
MERQSTTFILMKIIRDLNFNTNTEAREQQRRFVNERFQRSNTKIDHCIKSSAADLTELITNFSDIYTSIEQSKNRVQNVRERLRECKNLLLLKRQDIRKLWLLTSEQNALVKIYQNIDELKHVPLRLQFYLNKHLYIHASLLLLKAKEHQELRLINALSDIDTQLKDERVSLEHQLRSELINQLFEKPCRDILGNKNVSSSTNSTLLTNKNDHNYLSRIRENRLLRKQLDQDFESGKLLFESHSLAIIPDKYMLVDIRQQAPELYLDVLLQSLSILSRLNETLDYLQKQLHEQFHRIVLRTTQHIVDSNFVLHSNNSHQNLMVNNPDCLRDLLETCYEQFKLVVKNIEYILNILKFIQEHQAPVQIQQQEYIGIQTAENQRNLKSEQKQSIPVPVQFEIPYLFSIELAWETLQQVLSEVLNEYIEYNNTIDGSSPNSSLVSSSTDYSNRHSVVDFSQYLTKKAPPRSQQIPRLFEFSQSAQFNSMTSYLQEQNRFVIKQETTTATAATSYKQYVCKPNYRNITAVHDILQRIIEDIDANFKLHPTKRILDRKLTEFIRDRFIGRVIKDIRESAQLSSSTATADQNRLAELVPVVLQKQLQLPIPILQSTYSIFKSCEELCALVKCLPPYADDFCQAIIDLLFKHRESCNKLFLSIVERNDSPGTSIYSNEWVKDADINRHLRTMPAFDAFIRMAKQQHSANNDNQDDNADNIRFRQTKETETLLINFSQNEMNLDDICTTYKHIKLLANIHESLDWLYCKLSYYFDILDKCLNDTKHLDALTQTTVTSGYASRSLKQNHHQYEQLKLSRVNLEIFSNAMKTTLTLSYDILLVLFLEIRLHCFYHLSLLFRNASHYASVIDTDPDENIMTLNRDLTRLQETLHSALNEKKFSFLFQGLGFVLATILIRSAPRFIRISETGVTKMCRNIFAIEQTLTQIRTVGDAELMRAHRYYELLYATKPDEIIAVIEEHGPEYSEQDYIHLLQLKHRSFPAISGGGANPQPYPGAGGYVDDYQNAGGTKRQLLNLIRSVRTVMRVPLIAFNIITIIMSAVTGETPLNLEKDIERAIVLLDHLRTTSEIPETKLLELQRILQSDFFHAVREVYEKIYETVSITGSTEIRANAAAKATVAAFAASEGHSHPRVIELPKTAEGLGFNVMGGREQNSPIYISRIIPNGVAWKHGGLKKGDQLLSVDGVSVENEYHEKAVELLKQAQISVKLVVRYSPQVLIEMENRFEKQRTARRQPPTSTTPINK